MIELGRTIDAAINGGVLALDHAISGAALPGVVELVPTYRSLLVHYDPLVVGFDELEAELRRVVERGPSGAGGAGWVGGSGPETGSAASDALVEIPVVYGGEAGLDLADVARHAGLSDDEVVRRHAAGRYQVAMIGFAPGFPYLMGMDPAIACPRLETPRVRVPAGSVAIADTQTGIYPFAMPGGWRVIGRTDVRLFDPSSDPPARLRPGMRVRFMPVDPGAPSPAGSIDERPSPTPRSHRRSIRMLDPGFLATVQDRGRWGHQRFGVPPSGAADPVALRIGNRALGNAPAAAAIEIAAGGATFEFLAPCAFALTGAIAEATLDGRAVSFGTALSAPAGAVLRLGRPSIGLRTYLSVGGGLDVPSVLGSRSTYLPGGFGGLEGRPLRTGDVLGTGASDEDARGRGARARSSPSADGPPVGEMARGGATELPFVPGGQWEDFAEEDRQAFVTRQWNVSHHADRVGLRLEGQPLLIAGRAVRFVSDGTVTGAIQVAGDGRPIVLLVDRQTTGGYPKIGAVASAALHVLGQLAPGDGVRFRTMSVAEAQVALRSSQLDPGPAWET